MYRRGVLSLPLLLALPGCVTTADRIAADKAAGIRSVVLVPAFGDMLQLKYIGITIFENKTQDVKTDWRIDDHVRAVLSAHLTGRYEIRDVDYSVEDVFAPSTYGERVFGDTSGIAARLKTVIPAGRADAVIFVGPRSSADVIGNSPQSVAGLGLYKRVLLFASQPPTAFAFYRLIVFDGRSFEPLAASTGYMEGYKRPIAPLPFAWTGGSYETVSQSQRLVLRASIFDLLARSIPSTLARMSLLGSPAAPVPRTA